MIINAIDPKVNEWHVYKNGGLIKVLPKVSFSKAEAEGIWKQRFPNDEIVVKG